MQAANVYKFGDRVIVCSLSKTTAGVWIVNSSVTAVAASEKTRVGALVLEALDGSATGILHPKVWSGIFDSVLRAAGVKTYSSFMKKAALIDVRREKASIMLTPMQNLGPEEGFLPTESAKRALERPSPDVLGREIEQLLATR